MITIKIHDKEWFEEHCCINTASTSIYRPLIPTVWREKKHAVSWQSGGPMNELAGLSLLVTYIDKRPCASKMSSAKYVAGGYWIPNWAIEWVKEEVE